MCKKYYIQVMNEEIENSPTFEHLSDDDPSIFVNNLKLILSLIIANSQLCTLLLKCTSFQRNSDT